MRPSGARWGGVTLLVLVCLLGSCGFAFAARSAGQHSRYLAIAEHGVARTSLWVNRKRHWYNYSLHVHRRLPLASIWNVVPLWEAVDEIARASPTRKHLREVTRLANHAEHYWAPRLRPGPGYAPYPGRHHKPGTRVYFDDNGWWGLAFLDSYLATHRHRYLVDAERAFNFIARFGWDAKDGGGIWWSTWHGRRSGEALAPATELAARLYRVTRQQRYLLKAFQYITWANDNLLKWDGSYAGAIPHANEAAMSHDGDGSLLAAFAALCQARATVPGTVYLALPHNRGGAHPSYEQPAHPDSWCSWAEALASHTVYGVRAGHRVLHAYVPLNEGPQWDAIYVRDLLSLYSVDRRAGWYRVATGTAKRILLHARTRRGLFLRAWNGSRHIRDAGPGLLRTHAASVSVFAALAAVSRH
jgi:hypothetical protein